MTPTSNLRGILAMVLSMGLFIASDSASKFAFAHVPLFELVMLRGYAAVVLCLVLIVAMGHLASLHRMFNPWALARGLCEVGANLGFTIAIFHMPIADVTAIAQTAPLLVLLGASLIWSERLGISRLLFIGLGITGALLVAQPGATAASPYALLGFLVAACAAARDLITRKVPPDIPSPVVALSVLATLTLAGAIGTFTTETPIVPDPVSGLLIILAGALMIGGHVGVYLAYRMAPARTIAPFMYSLTLWAVLSSVVLFGDVPNLLAIFGMVLIVLAGLMVISVDARQSRSRV
jgi:drug/metabolite transporter (DMT)-like permease